MDFELGDILSVSHGVLLSRSGEYPVNGVYVILNFMTNDNIYTHQIGRTSKECEPFLRKQFPWLNEIDLSHITSENAFLELDKLCEKYGKFHMVLPIPAGDYKSQSPVGELVEIVKDPAKIVIAG